MNSICILRLTLLLTLVTYSIASIETETKYTIITQPGVISNTPTSKSSEDEDTVSTTDVTKEGTNTRSSLDENLEDAVSINVLQNGKKSFFIISNIKDLQNRWALKKNIRTILRLKNIFSFGTFENYYSCSLIWSENISMTNRLLWVGAHS